MNNLSKYYNDYDELGRLSRTKSQEMEYLTTLHALEPLLKEIRSIADIGAGAGKYAFHYANRGFNVIAVDPVSKHVDQMKAEAALTKMKLEVVKGDARNLDFLENESQEAALLLGPIYHLRNESERRSSIAEVNRILKPDGFVAVAYINKHFLASALLKNAPQFLSSSNLKSLSERGILGDDTEDEFLSVSYYSNPEEVEELIESCGFSIIDHLAVDGLSPLLHNSIDSLNEEQFQAWFEHHLSFCREKSILGYSNHGLVLARKTAKQIL